MVSRRSMDDEEDLRPPNPHEHPDCHPAGRLGIDRRADALAD